jgi:hypothetical protein
MTQVILAKHADWRLLDCRARDDRGLRFAQRHPRRYLHLSTPITQRASMR